MKQILQKNEGLQKLAEFLHEHDDYLLISHISPDGDTIGSALALFHVLRLHGKRVQIVCTDRVPLSIAFLPGAGEVIVPDKAVRAENVIAIDCADKRRLGKAESLFDNAKNTFNIDHHDTNTRYAAFNEVHSRCAANAEVMYELIRLFAGTCSPDVATCLYTGVMTDTGSFAFSNTTADTFAVATELVKLGANPNYCNTQVYRTIPLAKTKLLGKALSSVEMYDGGRIALCVITQQDIALCKAHAEDAEGIIDHLRDIDTVEVAVIIRECLDGDYKVGFRSKNYVDVAQVAGDFGGGGHVRASGCKVSMPLGKLHDTVIESVKTAIAQAEDEDA